MKTHKLGGRLEPEQAELKILEEFCGQVLQALLGFQLHSDHISQKLAVRKQALEGFRHNKHQNAVGLPSKPGVCVCGISDHECECQCDVIRQVWNRERTIQSLMHIVALS